MKNNKDKQVVFLCGGRGLRLMPLTDKIPKPMICVNGKPFLKYLFDQFYSAGFRNFLFLAGYKSHLIEEYFETLRGKNLIINIKKDSEEWDTAKRIYHAKKFLKKNFFLMYADNYSPLNLNQIISKFDELQCDHFMTVVKKNPGNISLNSNLCKSYSILKSRKFNFVEIGYMICKKQILFEFLNDKNINFSNILKKIISKHRVGYFMANYYNSISDQQRLKITKKYFKFKKIIFIDRDGVINFKAKKARYICDVNEFKFIKSNLQGMRKLSKLGYQFILITNQAGVARQFLSLNKLKEIHSYMKHELKKNSIILKDIIFCPHGWNDNCFCRKPKPGMLVEAVKKYHLKLDDYFFIGDDIRDCQAAANGYCKSIYLGPKKELKKLKHYEKPFAYYSDLNNSYSDLKKKLVL